MKLENCGRCGLEPVAFSDEDYKPHDRAACPACDDLTRIGRWNAAQFAARTERINAAALVLDAALIVAPTAPVRTDSIRAAVSLIDEQDAATRVRWAEMQKGGE